MSSQEYIKDDEINLRDYIKVILKRKKLILSIFFVTVITTTIVSFLMPKVYKIDSTIRIGSIGGNLFSVNEAIEKLRNRNSLQSIVLEMDGGITTDCLKRAIKIENIKDTSFLKLQMESAEPDIAVKILNRIVDKFVLEGNEIFKKNIIVVKEELNGLEKREGSIREDIENLKKKISKHRLSSHFSSALGSLVRHEGIYGDIDKREHVLRERLFVAKSFGIVEPPAKSINPIKPKKRQMIAISGVVGLMMGMLLAFFMEYWQSSKQT